MTKVEGNAGPGCMLECPYAFDSGLLHSSFHQRLIIPRSFDFLASPKRHGPYHHVHLLRLIFCEDVIR